MKEDEVVVPRDEADARTLGNINSCTLNGSILKNPDRNDKPLGICLFAEPDTPIGRDRHRCVFEDNGRF